MSHTQTVHIPARLSNLGIDEIYYESPKDNWHKRAVQLQRRRWHKLHMASGRLHLSPDKEQL